jgi:hypothetical protein
LETCGQKTGRGQETHGLEVKWSKEREKITRFFLALAEIIDHQSAYLFLL